MSNCFEASQEGAFVTRFSTSSYCDVGQFIASVGTGL
jgi:hypothetical protein